MGLRIIDRHKPAPPKDVSEAEMLAGLAAETRTWPQARARPALDIQGEFIDNFRRVKARIESVAQVAEMATRVRANILGHQAEGTTSPHGPVDIATLLELL